MHSSFIRYTFASGKRFSFTAGLCTVLCFMLWGGVAQAQQQMRTNLAGASAIPQGYTLTDTSEITSENDPNINDSERTRGSDVGVVDWVEVQIRVIANTERIPTVAPADAAAVSYESYIKAAWLLSDGSVVDVDSNITEINDGTVEPELTIPTDDTGLTFDANTQNLYVLVSHRNHLPIMSASAISADTDSVYNYDFTTGVSQAVGGASALNDRDSASSMIPGNPNGDAGVTPADISLVRSNLGSPNAYDNSDIDLNAAVGNSDTSRAQANSGAAAAITY